MVTLVARNLVNCGTKLCVGKDSRHTHCLSKRAVNYCRASCSRAGLSSGFSSIRTLKLENCGILTDTRRRFTVMAAQKTVGLTKASKPILPEVDFVTSDAVTLESPIDVLIVGVFEEALNKDDSFSISLSALKDIDVALNGVLGDMIKDEDFKGGVGKVVSARVQGKPLKRVALVGLGKAAGATSPNPWKALGGAVASISKETKASTVGVSVLGATELSVDTKKTALGGITSGTILGAFEDTRFKTDSKPPTLKTVTVSGLSSGAELQAEIGKASRVAVGTILTKQLVNAPPNVLTPEALADVAVSIAAAHADVFTATILDEAECEKLGMGAYLGVAAASENPPKFIHLKYSPPGGEVTKRLAIIGKGLTFDSGGYNIKAGAGSMIELMKFDMGGAGATLGAAKAIGAIQPAGIEVHFIIAACENMISGGGMRPGDILTASNGRTIEVNNTDAEGRLTLADALVYACKLKVDGIVDLATLTGACIIALGNDIAGMFTPSDGMAAELSAASQASGEKLWRMPMEESYGEMLKSNIADTVNTGGRAGGSITAALFLKEFVDADIPWAHLDIAGPVWSDKKGGGTGFAVATLVEWLLANAK